jgi:hypothetical protein
MMVPLVEPLADNNAATKGSHGKVVPMCPTDAHYSVLTQPV